MPTASSTRLALPWVAAYLAVLVSRLVLVAVPPAGYLYTEDEMYLTLSAVDRFLGLPSVTMAWPASTLQMVATALVGGRLAFGCLRDVDQAANLSCLAVGAGELYTSPWGLLAATRIVTVVLASTIPLLLAAAVRRQSGNWRAAAVAGLSTAVMGSLWQYSAMATADAGSVALGLAAVVAALPAGECGRPGRPLLAGILVGAALATKLTVVGLGLLAGAVVLLAPRLTALRWRAAAAWALGAAASFLAFCPYVWIEPVRFLKSTIGNAAARPGSPQGLSAVWDVLTLDAGVLTWTLIPLALLGLMWLAGSSQRRWQAWAFLGAIVIQVIPLALAGHVYPRYGLPLLATLTVLMGYGISAIVEFWPTRQNTIALVLCLPIVAASVQTVRAERGLRVASPLLAATETLLAETSTGDLYLPYSVVYQSLSYASRDDIGRMRRAAERMVRDPRGTVAFLSAHGLDVRAAGVLVDSFNEDERVTLRRLTAMEPLAAPSPRAVHFYFEGDDRDGLRIALFESTQPAVVETYLHHPGPAALLVRQALPDPGGEVANAGGGWFIYRKPAGLPSGPPR